MLAAIETGMTWVGKVNIQVSNMSLYQKGAGREFSTYIYVCMYVCMYVCSKKQKKNKHGPPNTIH
jgi:hypothetical protein